ncbi:tRNA (N6-threonylcarbamoyladenosine(37)-N6)-methyltransferase TrmO [Marinomonas balearica]|uniref:tRNA-Thr(GGU) m(6)t(6)A37 methyltransferase TsaA n=1 Tax=Marinomonas balearica TaxID=491947 RepID=A0A4R6MDA2_9GAMM|nr:tRNA (N6-threonylcarbamoyladenosine(37)-N6)-methyltransferase TrmO [Marinomonas balearica]TDO99661.1 tRNA-Thr(GGU) m(6)t(6)A37 methyltransferase TsaA [Marinomonas balearica]
MTSPTTFEFNQIGIIHSCYTEKFGIPRQPGLVKETTATLELLPPFNREDTLDGLEGFSHIWVHFIFHQCIQEKWKAKVRPPRLGGKAKMGVFATRATHRPNPIGLSVIKIGKIHKHNKRIFIDLHGADLLDGTPVIDIKPYLPYADIQADACGGFAPEKSPAFPVKFTEEAKQQAITYKNKFERNLLPLIEQVIEQDPRPSYLSNTTDRQHGVKLWNSNVKWLAKNDHFLVTEIEIEE